MVSASNFYETCRKETYYRKTPNSNAQRPTKFKNDTSFWILGFGHWDFILYYAPRCPHPQKSLCGIYKKHRHLVGWRHEGETTLSERVREVCFGNRRSRASRRAPCPLPGEVRR